MVWGRGDSCVYIFEIYVCLGISGSWIKVYDDVSLGMIVDIEVFDIDDIVV